MINPKKALKKCQGKQIDQAEVYYQKTNQKEIEIEGKDIKYTKENENEGLGIRIIKKEKIGFASTSNKQKIDETIDKAIKNSEINNLELPSFAKKQDYPDIKGIHDKKTAKYPMNQLIDDANQLIKETTSDNVKPTSASINQSETKKRILNTNGIDEKTKKTTITATIEALAQSEKNTSTAFNHETKTSVKEIDFKEIANEAKKIAKKSISSKKRVKGEKNVILEPFAVASLLKSTFIPSLSAEEIQKNRSRVPEFLNEEIGPYFLNVNENGLLDNKTGSRKFDDEAVSTTNRKIIDEGELKGIFHNLKTSFRSGEDPTGNAVRESYTKTPEIGPNNFIIQGDEDRNNFIEEDDLKIRSVLGAHTANKLTGDFSLGIKNGFLIKNGKEKPIKQAMVSGNIYELIQKIKAIGKKKKEIGGIISPKIKTKLTISG